ncbi:MAG: cytochrome b/b6 domain-containing protein [Halarcobacter sp.]
MKTIKAYHPLIMTTHKFILIQTITLIITGLPFFSKTFSFLAYYVGYPASIVLKNNEALVTGLMIFRTLHWVSGFLLAITSLIFAIVMLRRLKELSIWPEKWGVEAIIDGIKQMKLHYIENKPAKFGKYNMGQKASAWAMYFFVTALIVTGFILVYKSANAGALSLRDAEFIGTLHSFSFIMLGIILIIHVIFALLPSNLPAFKAMFQTGEMSIDHVKEHHIYWYERLKKQKIIKDEIEEK